MNLKHAFITASGVLLILLAETVCYADSSEARKLVAQGEILPLEDILNRVKQLHEGRILEVELEQKHERLIYEIELITSQGLVWELYFDARSGQLIKSKQDD